MILCGWYARQTIPLSVLARNQRPELEISDKTGSGGEKTSWQRNPERVSWQRNLERVSWRRETQRGSRERTAEGTSQNELAVQSGQRSAEGGGGEDSQRWLGIPSGFWRSFAKNTLPAIVYKMQKKMYTKCHKTTLLALGADLSQYCSFVLFLPLPRWYFLWS